MKLSVFFQRLEAGVLLVAMLASFIGHNYNWLYFVAGFLVIDLSMVGYLVNNKIGAILYNMFHSLIGPLFLAALAASSLPQLDIVATIWLAHIAMDRMLGFGLKEVEGFHHTHLGHLKKRS